MTIVVKLGGTNGSGKTSVARALLEIIQHKYVNLPNGNQSTEDYAGGRIESYGGELVGLTWVVLGSYKNVCGGMDTISDKEVRLDMIHRGIEDYDVVFFEGLITGKTYGAIGELSEKPPHKWIYAFMDTPFDVCVDRVMARRAAAGNAAPFAPERTMRPTYKSVQATSLRAGKQGHKVLWLPHKQPPKILANLIIDEVISEKR